MRVTGCHMEPVRTPLGIVDSSVSLPYKISYKTIDSTMAQKRGFSVLHAIIMSIK